MNPHPRASDYPARAPLNKQFEVGGGGGLSQTILSPWTCPPPFQWGSVGTTYQGKGRVSREVNIGQAGTGRAQGGERPMGVGYGDRVQGKCTVEWREANRRRQLQTATQPGVMPNPPFQWLWKLGQ